jgi:hypothetical protein
VGRRYKLVRIEHVIEDCSEGEEGALPGVQDILDDGPPGEGQVGQLHLHACTTVISNLYYSDERVEEKCSF